MGMDAEGQGVVLPEQARESHRFLVGVTSTASFRKVLPSVVFVVIRDITIIVSLSLFSALRRGWYAEWPCSTVATMCPSRFDSFASPGLSTEGSISQSLPKTDQNSSMTRSIMSAIAFSLVAVCNGADSSPSSTDEDGDSSVDVLSLPPLSSHSRSFSSPRITSAVGVVDSSLSERQDGSSLAESGVDFGGSHCRTTAGRHHCSSSEARAS